MVNTTLSGNSAGENGGAIHFEQSDATREFKHVTITANRADSKSDSSGEGGGIMTSDSLEVSMLNSIVAGNFQGPGSQEDDIAGMIPFSLGNLVGEDPLVSAAVGTQITLASGALLQINADDRYTYDLNGVSESLAVNQPQPTVLTIRSATASAAATKRR